MPGNYSPRPPATKAISILWRFCRVGFKIETEFRTDFIISVIHFLTYNALYIVFWQALVGQVDSLGAWTMGELVVLSFVVALQGVLTIPFLGLQGLPARVREGALDKYLCRPIDPILAVSFESIHVTAFLRSLAVGLVALGASLAYYDFDITLGGAILSALLLILGTLTWAFFNGTVALLSFWLGKVQVLTRVIQMGVRFRVYPVTIFPTLARRALTWVIPVALVATYPTMVLLGKASNVLAILGVTLALTLVWGAIFVLLSRKALHRYESFGG
jgi:ABC-2 type transport system permease protein